MTRLGLQGWVLLAGSLVFAAGGSVGFLAGRFLEPPVEQDDRFPEPVEPVPLQGSLLHVTNDKVYELLGLGPDQRAQADQILAAHYESLKHLLKEREALDQKVDSDLVNLLTPAQREQWDNIKREIDLPRVLEKVSQKLVFYKVELKLNEPQERPVYSILLAHELARDQLFREVRTQKAAGKDCREEMKKRLDTLSEERRTRLLQVLSEEQWKRFVEMDDHNRRIFERGPRPRGKGPPQGKRPEGPEPLPPPVP